MVKFREIRMMFYENGRSEFLVGPVSLCEDVLCQPLPHSEDLFDLVQR